MIKMLPVEARRIADKYDILPIEVTRLVQMKNFDNMNGTIDLQERYNEVCYEIKKLRYNKNKTKMFEHWTKRRKFMRDMFFLKETKEEAVDEFAKCVMEVTKILS